jgi:hypothetical protein
MFHWNKPGKKDKSPFAPTITYGKPDVVEEMEMEMDEMEEDEVVVPEKKSGGYLPGERLLKKLGKKNAKSKKDPSVDVDRLARSLGRVLSVL